MGYQLGIDLGTTFAAAATCRDGRAEIASLGNRGAAVPSVVYLRPDATLVVGETAERRALMEPTRVAREFKRRMGDPTPILLGGTPYSAESLQAKLLRSVVDAVEEREGSTPDAIALTHPANWGPYKKDLFEQTIRLADLAVVKTLTEPEAAAIYYASSERIDPGAVVAVYDLGGGTFDAAVLRRTQDGFEILGEPEGIERLGGIDLDEAVFVHVDRALGGALRGQDGSDPAVVGALSRVRQECVAAKEALSTDTDAVVPVMLPDLQTEVRLTRAEFEEMVRPTLDDTVEALRRALRSAHLDAEDVTRVLLVGGSSRIPLVAEMVSGALGRPVAVDAHPKYAVALGAAQAASTSQALAEVGAAAPEPVVVEPVVVEPVVVEPVAAVGDRVAPVMAEPVAAPPTTVVPGGAASEPFRPSEEPRARRTPILVGAMVLVAVVVAVATYYLRDGGGGGTDEAPLAATRSEAAEQTEGERDPDPSRETTPSEPEAKGAPGEPFARVTGIKVSGADYVVDFETSGYEPQLGEGSQHVHFRFDTVPPEESGVPGGGPWRLYPTQPGVVGTSPFTGMAVADRPAGATAICVLVANPDHSVVPDTGTCFPLP